MVIFQIMFQTWSDVRADVQVQQRGQRKMCRSVSEAGGETNAELRPWPYVH